MDFWVRWSRREDFFRCEGVVGLLPVTIRLRSFGWGQADERLSIVVLMVVYDETATGFWQAKGWYKLGTLWANFISLISVMAMGGISPKPLRIGQSRDCLEFVEIIEISQNRTHNPKVAGSNPAPATKKIKKD